MKTDILLSDCQQTFCYFVVQDWSLYCIFALLFHSELESLFAVIVLPQRVFPTLDKCSTTRPYPQLQNYIDSFLWWCCAWCWEKALPLSYTPNSQRTFVEYTIILNYRYKANVLWKTSNPQTISFPASVSCYWCASWQRVSRNRRLSAAERELCASKI